jgi:hypothetical protein
MSQGRHKLSAVRPVEFEHPTGAERAEDRATAAGLSELLQRRRTGDRIVAAVVDEITADGIPLVVLSGDTQPREASTLLRFSSQAAASSALLRQTVLVMDNGVGRPVIIGIVSDRLWDTSSDAHVEAQVQLPADIARKVQLDKRQLEFEASDEIRLTCGKSSLLLRRDGTVILKGVRITSRALEANKIRGATVNIN